MKIKDKSIKMEQNVGTNCGLLLEKSQSLFEGVTFTMFVRFLKFYIKRYARTKSAMAVFG